MPSPLKLPRSIADLRGRVFRDRYAVNDLVARGPNHAIFSGTDNEAKREVLIDIQRPPQLHDVPTARRFEQRVKALRRVKDARVVRPADSGETADGRFFLVSERPAGESVDRWVLGTETGRRPWQQVVPVLRQIAQALAVAHRRKVVHGRINPSVCWVSHEDATQPPSVRVLRFGSNLDPAIDDTEATVTGTTAFANDAVYMAPETVGGIAGDAAVDMYLFGLVAYFMLAGRPPFSGNNAFVVASMHAHSQVPPLREQVKELPPDLASVVHSLLAKQRDDRPPSIASVDELLRQFDCLHATPQPSPTDVGGAGSSKPGRPKAGRRGRAQRAAAQRPAVGLGGKQAPRDQIASRLSSGRPAPPPSQSSADSPRRPSPNRAILGSSGPPVNLPPPRETAAIPPTPNEDLAATETFSREALRAAMPPATATTSPQPPEATIVLGGTPGRGSPAVADVESTEMLPRYWSATGTGQRVADSPRPRTASHPTPGSQPQTELLDVGSLRTGTEVDPLQTDVLVLETQQAAAAPLARPLVNMPREASVQPAGSSGAPPAHQPSAPPSATPNTPAVSYEQQGAFAPPATITAPRKMSGAVIMLVAGSVAAIVAGVAAGAWLAG